MTNSSCTKSEKVTVVIPNWNGMKWLRGCLDSLKNQCLPNFKTVLVDNGSEDGSLLFVRQSYHFVEVVSHPHNMGFAKAVNVGVERAITPYVALLNTDTIVDRHWLRYLCEALDNAPLDVVAVNPLMLSMDNPSIVDDAGDKLSWYGAATKHGNGRTADLFQHEIDIFSPSGGGTLFRRDFLVEAGGFDEMFFAYLEDIDLGLRGRLAGYRYIYIPRAKMLHKSHGSELSRGRYVELITRNRLLVFVKNIPFTVLLRQAPKIIFGQLYFFIAYGQPLSSLKGYWLFMLALPTVLRRRRPSIKRIRIEYREIVALLDPEKPHPPLTTIVKGYASRGLRKIVPRPLLRFAVLFWTR